MPKLRLDPSVGATGPNVSVQTAYTLLGLNITMSNEHIKEIQKRFSMDTFNLDST